MNKETDPRQTTARLINVAGLLMAVLLFGAYLYLYQYVPLEETWNNAALNIITSLAALLAALLATAIYLHYHPEDFPRKIWLHLMLGCWFWFLGETIWGIIAYIKVAVPTPSIADSGWVIGLLFFTFAFYYQYLIIFPAQKQRIISIAVGAWAVSIIVPAVALLATNSFSWESYVNYYYPIADLAVGIAGIALIVAFQGGALMRPWIGMVVFGISDFFYAWANQSGLYEWSSANNSTLTLAIDASYLAAYLILAFGFLGHWLLINYGLRGKQ